MAGIYDPFNSLVKEAAADDRRDELAAILLAIQELRDAIEAATTPVVPPAVDFGPVIAAIRALPAAVTLPPQPVHSSPTAEDIAEAIKRVNAFEIEMRSDDELKDTLKELADAIEKMRQRNGMGSAPYISGNGVTNLSRTDRELLTTINTSISSLTSISSPLSAYQANDLDETGDPAYYGYETAGGAWMIKRLNSAAGTIRYARGDSNYAAAWTARAGQSYDTFGAVF